MRLDSTLSHPWWLLCLAAFVYAALVTLLIACGYVIVTIWKLLQPSEIPQAVARRAVADDLASKRTHAA